MVFLRSVEFRDWKEREAAEFPFSLDVIRSAKQLCFTAPVTFFVGENGSGKSTMLEALACAADSVAVGSESVQTDKTLAPLRRLAKYLRLVWEKHTHRGFFLRAEDFFGYAKKIRQTAEELRQQMNQVDEDYQGRSEYAANLARMPYARELGEIGRRYGEGLDSRSHGESFLALFQARFVADGLYLLDEPEAALSPMRQLTFISALKRMVDQNSQFIIATHSPVIVAFPGAAILSFDNGRITPIRYDELEHVNLTRDFLNKPESFLRHL
jgi:predicted ATPase